MLRSQGALYNRAGQHIGLDEVTNLKPMEVPKEVIELLMLRQPTMPVRSNKKERRNKKKKNSQLHRERAALKRVTRLGNSDGDNKFKFDPDRPYETGKTLTEFTLFNELAPEVRFMIWKEAFPAPQAVKIRSDAVNYEQRPTLLTVVHRMRYRAKGSYVPSPLLSVNAESRELMEAEYPLLFHAQLGGRPIRFNFEKDILYFLCPAAVINFYGGTLPMFAEELQTFGFVYDMSDAHDKVQNIAIGNIKFHKASMGSVLNMFKALKTVVLGVAKGEDIIQDSDGVIDHMTGDSRLALGWERYQGFKTIEDGNMPAIKRLRADEFKKLMVVKYKQTGRQRKKAPSLVIKPIPFSPAAMAMVAGAIPASNAYISPPSSATFEGVDTMMQDEDAESPKELVCFMGRNVRVNC